MPWTEKTSFFYFLAGILPGLAAIDRGLTDNVLSWIIIGVIWPVIIFVLIYWRNK